MAAPPSPNELNEKSRISKEWIKSSFNIYGQRNTKAKTCTKWRRIFNLIWFLCRQVNLFLFHVFSSLFLYLSLFLSLFLCMFPVQFSSIGAWFLSNAHSKWKTIWCFFPIQFLFLFYFRSPKIIFYFFGGCVTCRLFVSMKISVWSSFKLFDNLIVLEIVKCHRFTFSMMRNKTRAIWLFSTYSLSLFCFFPLPNAAGPLTLDTNERLTQFILLFCLFYSFIHCLTALELYRCVIGMTFYLCICTLCIYISVCKYMWVSLHRNGLQMKV